jgi:prepilin-type processing-associated H-X9-DG protein
MDFLTSSRGSVDPYLQSFADADGRFSLRSFHAGGANFAMADGSVRFVTSSLSADLLKAMKVGQNREDWQNAGSIAMVTSSSNPAIYNFEDLTTLTKSWVTDLKTQSYLLRSVQAAADAAATGNLQLKAQALSDYVAILQKVKGTGVDYLPAESLSQIAKSL